jgi:two-component system NtrC family sensor kinase
MSAPHDPISEELGTARQRLAEAYKLVALGRLVNGIVHEINTPIGSTVSNKEVSVRLLVKLRVLLTATGGQAAALEILETLESLAAVNKLACERITSVIRSLKTHARTDQSELRTADINDLLRNAIKLGGTQFRRRVNVVTQFAELPEVECFAHRLSQVFLNLLVNAAQAIEGTGTITVRTRLEGNSVLIEMSDTGRGIDAEHRARIFRPGFTSKPLGVGTGLGLAISRQIVVEGHGGTIDFESEPGRGTTFFVRLPIAHPANRESGSFTEV